MSFDQGLTVSSPGAHPPLQAVRLIRPLIGRSGPCLIQGDDGGLYILKTWGNNRHPNLLANEFLGSALCAAVGLPVAKSRAIRLSPDFLERTSLSIRYGGYTHRPETGMHWASEFVGPLTDRVFVVESVTPNLADHVRNKADFLRMYLLDVCVKHRDRRQAVFIRDKGAPTSRAVFIDHGHMFGGSNWDLNNHFSSPIHPLFASDDSLFKAKAVAYLLSAFAAKLPNAVDTAIKQLPSEWYTGDLSSLQIWLHHRIESLPRLTERLGKAPVFRKDSDATLHVQGSRTCHIGA